MHSCGAVQLDGHQAGWASSGLEPRRGNDVGREGGSAPLLGLLGGPRGRHDGGDSAAAFPIGNDGELAGLQGVADIIANLVGHGLEEDAGIAEGVKIQLERLQLDTGLFGHETNLNRGEIRVAGDRAHRREFVVRMLDHVVAMRSGIREGFEDLWIGHDAESSG